MAKRCALFSMSITFVIAILCFKKLFFHCCVSIALNQHLNETRSDQRIWVGSLELVLFWCVFQFLSFFFPCRLCVLTFSVLDKSRKIVVSSPKLWTLLSVLLFKLFNLRLMLDIQNVSISNGTGKMKSTNQKKNGQTFSWCGTSSFMLSSFTHKIQREC